MQERTQFGPVFWAQTLKHTRTESASHSAWVLFRVAWMEKYTQNDVNTDDYVLSGENVYQYIASIAAVHSVLKG